MKPKSGMKSNNVVGVSKPVLNTNKGSRSRNDMNAGLVDVLSL